MKNHNKYSLKELESMPTLSTGHTDDLKIDKPMVRVWLSRMTKADGMPYKNQVTIEQLEAGRWVTKKQYKAI